MIHPGSRRVAISCVGEGDVRMYITPIKVKVSHEAMKDRVIRTGFSEVNIKFARIDDAVICLVWFLSKRNLAHYYHCRRVDRH